MCLGRKMEKGLRLKKDFQIVRVADENMVIPIGEAAFSFRGIVIISEETAFLLKQLGERKTEKELEKLLTDCYNVEQERAKRDVSAVVEKLLQMGVLEDI